MSFAGAYEALSKLRIEGISTHYDISDLPNVIPPGNLPARVLEIDYTYADAVRPLGFSLRSARASYFVLLTLCLRNIPVSGAGNRVADIPLWFDRYIESFNGNWLLDGHLTEPIRTVVMRSGVVGWAGMTYVGCVFRLSLSVRYDF